MEIDRETTWTNVFKIMISNGPNPKTLAKIPVQTQTQKRIDLSSNLKDKIAELNRIKLQITSKPTFSPPMKQDERSSTWITIFDGLKKIDPKLLDPANTNVLVRDQKGLTFSSIAQITAKTLPIRKTNLIADANANANANQQSIQQMLQVNNLQTQIDNMNNHFKLEKAQMDIMFGMKMDLIKKQHEHHIQDTIANGNSSNGNLVEQIKDLKEQIGDLEEFVKNVKNENTRLNDENTRLKDENKTDQTKTDTIGTTGDNEKLAQLQTRVMKLTQELLIIKMNEDLRSKKYANYKLTAAPTKLNRNTFAKSDFIGINMAGGAPKQKLFMKGGAPKEFSIEFNDAEEILVIFNKSDKSLIQTPDDPKMTYCTVEMITEYNKKLKDLKDENDSLKKSSQSSVATPNSDAMKTLTEKLIALQTLYKDLQQNLRSEQIKNSSNLCIQSTLKSSLTNPNAITDLTKENDALKADTSKLKAENNNLTKEKDTLKTENDNLTSAKTTLEADKTTLESAKTTLEADKTTLKNANTQLETENAGLKTTNAGLKTTNANLTTQLNATSTSLGMSTVISNANATLRRIPKGFISDNGNVMFSEHK